MIWESWPWKQDLARRAQALRLRMVQRRWSEASLARVEQDVFIAAYSVRKLVEAQKLSNEVESISLLAIAHDPAKPGVDLMNWHKIGEYYDLEKSHPVRISLLEFCNQFIHSFVFAVRMGPKVGLEGVYVTSDRDRASRLLYFPIDEIIEVMQRIAKDDIVGLQAIRDAATGEFRFIKKTCRQEGAR